MGMPEAMRCDLLDPCSLTEYRKLLPHLLRKLIFSFLSVTTMFAVNSPTLFFSIKLDKADEAVYLESKSK